MNRNSGAVFGRGGEEQSVIRVVTARRQECLRNSRQECLRYGVFGWGFIWLAALTLCAAYGAESGSPENQVIAATNSFENSLGMKFVAVPGAKGRFAVWETRVQDYQTFVQATGRAWTKPDFAQEPQHPVVNVTWEDAVAFCNWLTASERKLKRITDKQRYRLPTDQEWSLAVGLISEAGKNPEERMKTFVVWPWGYYWPPQPGDGNYAPELGVDKFADTAPVGSFKPNAFGIYDLGGNVWEWCDDWYNGTHVTKTLRGGSFHDSQPKDLLAAYRFSGTMHLNNDDIGFRMVLE